MKIIQVFFVRRMYHRAIHLCPEEPELGPDAGFFVFLLFDPPPKKFAIMSDLKLLQILKKINEPLRRTGFQGHWSWVSIPIHENEILHFYDLGHL